MHAGKKSHVWSVAGSTDGKLKSDKVLIEACGAYTTTYSSVGFNGFAPLASYVI